MPARAPRLCPRCKAIITAPRCPACAPAWGTSKRPGGSRAWRRLRVQVFTEQGGICAWPGCTRYCEELDHVHGWEQGDHRDNLQGLCIPHHREKTQQEARDAQAGPH